jgi:hypothetical protein
VRFFFVRMTVKIQNSSCNNHFIRCTNGLKSCDVVHEFYIRSETYILQVFNPFLKMGEVTAFIAMVFYIQCGVSNVYYAVTISPHHNFQLT